MAITVTEDTQDLTRKYLVPGTTWKEPKRHGKSPDMTVEAVADEIGFTIQSVHIYARRGPEHGGFAGYIPAKNGRGWQRKIVPWLTKAEQEDRTKILALLSKEEQQSWRERLQAMPEKEKIGISPYEGYTFSYLEKLLYEARSGIQLWFYPEDIEAWKMAHPIVEKSRKPIEYTQEEYEFVTSHAENMRNPDGSVTRTKLFKYLAALQQEEYEYIATVVEQIKREEDAITRTKLLRHLADFEIIEPWNTRTYALLKEIAYEGLRRNNHPDVTAFIEQIKQAEPYVVEPWNTRTYAKLKQILDDAGYPLPPQMKKDTSLRRTLRRKFS